jgi:hypothetical protein
LDAASYINGAELVADNAMDKSQSMIRKSGNRFSEKIMLPSKSAIRPRRGVMRKHGSGS